MITRSTEHPSVWDARDAIPSMLPEILPQLVEYAAAQGGAILVTQDRRIYVKDAIEQKEQIEYYALEARKQLALHESTSNIYDQMGYKSAMKQAVNSAGAFFRLYVRALGRTVNPDKVTTLISDHPSFKAFWDAGYLHMDRSLSQPYYG